MKQLSKINRFIVASIGVLVMMLFSFQKIDKNKNYRNLIIGSWQGKEDTLKMVLKFNKNEGAVTYLQLNKKYTFHYSFKNDSVIALTDSKGKAHLHLIKELDKEHLQLRPYPSKKIREEIELIDDISFRKEK